MACGHAAHFQTDEPHSNSIQAPHTTFETPACINTRTVSHERRQTSHSRDDQSRQAQKLDETPPLLLALHAQIRRRWNDEKLRRRGAERRRCRGEEKREDARGDK